VVFGLDAPSETEVVAGLLGEPIDDDEFDIRFAGLQTERDPFMMLIAMALGPPVIDGRELPATRYLRGTELFDPCDEPRFQPAAIFSFPRPVNPSPQ
jgi:hypothetical protein